MKNDAAPIAIAPVVEGYVDVRRQTMQLIGIDPLADDVVRGDRHRPRLPGAAPRANTGGDGIAAATRWFTEPGAAVMARERPTRLGIAANGKFGVRIGGSTHEATLIGYPPGSGAGFDTLLLADIAQAQEWLGLAAASLASTARAARRRRASERWSSCARACRPASIFTPRNVARSRVST